MDAPGHRMSCLHAQPHAADSYTRLCDTGKTKGQTYTSLPVCTRHGLPQPHNRSLCVRSHAELDAGMSHECANCYSPSSTCSLLAWKCSCRGVARTLETLLLGFSNASTRVLLAPAVRGERAGELLAHDKPFIYALQQLSTQTRVQRHTFMVTASLTCAIPS